MCASVEHIHASRYCTGHPKSRSSSGSARAGSRDWASVVLKHRKPYCGREIAFNAISLDSNYQVKSCRRALLEQNAKCMQDGLEYNPECTEEMTAYPDLRVPDSMVQNFSSATSCPAHLRGTYRVSVSNRTSTRRTAGWRTMIFATILSQRAAFSSSLRSGGCVGVELPDILRSTGITISDIVNALIKSVDDDLKVSDVASFLGEELKYFPESTVMPNWSITRAFSRFKTLRGSLSILCVVMFQ
ncbi:hypothetical protein BKA93DRAFT_510639 [Sparassis latifolia]